MEMLKRSTLDKKKSTNQATSVHSCGLLMEKTQG